MKLLAPHKKMSMDSVYSAREGFLIHSASDLFPMLMLALKIKPVVQHRHWQLPVLAHRLRLPLAVQQPLQPSPQEWHRPGSG
jgi:hypothetical protein